MMIRVSFLIVILLLNAVITVSAQSVVSKNYYIVIGEFMTLDEAQQLTDEANLKTFSAQFVLDDKKHHYYVYLLKTPDQHKAKSFLKKIRKETEYKKARLYKGNLGEAQ